MYLPSITISLMFGAVENVRPWESFPSTKLFRSIIQDSSPLLKAVLFGISVENFGGNVSEKNCT